MGDFNANGIFDAEDIDLLNAEIRSGTNNPDFDLVEDGVVDAFDRTFWVHTINNTYFGDANLDGEFNSGDLVAVFQAGHYENGSTAGWAAATGTAMPSLQVTTWSWPSKTAVMKLARVRR